jgi:hypothetical protein
MAPTQSEFDMLLQMGFTQYQVDEAFKKHSTLEAAANFLMDTPIPPSDVTQTQPTDQNVSSDDSMGFNSPEETWVEHRGRTDKPSTIVSY